MQAKSRIVTVNGQILNSEAGTADAYCCPIQTISLLIRETVVTSLAKKFGAIGRNQRFLIAFALKRS